MQISKEKLIHGITWPSSIYKPLFAMQVQGSDISGLRSDVSEIFPLSYSAGLRYLKDFEVTKQNSTPPLL